LPGWAKTGDPTVVPGTGDGGKRLRQRPGTEGESWWTRMSPWVGSPFDPNPLANLVSVEKACGRPQCDAAPPAFLLFRRLDDGGAGTEPDSTAKPSHRRRARRCRPTAVNENGSKTARCAAGGAPACLSGLATPAAARDLFGSPAAVVIFWRWMYGVRIRET